MTQQSARYVQLAGGGAEWAPPPCCRYRIAATLLVVVGADLYSQQLKVRCVTSCKGWPHFGFDKK